MTKINFKQYLLIMALVTIASFALVKAVHGAHKHCKAHNPDSYYNYRFCMGI